MGSWGYGIMDGDTPLDILGCMEDITGKVTGDSINTHIDAILSIPKNSKWGNWNVRDKRILLQVVGFQIITSGAKLSAKLRDRIIRACDGEIAEIQKGNHGWVLPKQRIWNLEQLKKNIKNYNSKQRK